MNKDIKNLDLLFSENQRDIYLGLLEKKDWINRKLILNGCLDYYLDEKNRRRFFFLENLFDNVVAFHPVTYQNKSLNEPKEISINEQLSVFKKATFKTKIDLTNGAPFYVEYDFNLLDAPGYKTLFANFYFNHKEEDLEINLEPEDLDPKDLIKLSIIGKEDECSIVLTDDNLINGVYFLPIVSKIYIARAIEEDLFKELKRYCEDNEIELDVITSKTI
jgi:hypothetical protein